MKFHSFQSLPGKISRFSRTESVHKIIWHSSKFHSLTSLLQKFQSFRRIDSVYEGNWNIPNFHSFKSLLRKTWSFLRTDLAYEITWIFSKLVSSNSLLRKISTVRRPIRGHRNGSKKITKFHSLNSLLIKIYFLPKLIRFMKQIELFKKNFFFANWFNL